jgi:hypothetical protein
VGHPHQRSAVRKWWPPKIIVILKTKDLAKLDPENKGLSNIVILKTKELGD